MMGWQLTDGHMLCLNCLSNVQVPSNFEPCGLTQVGWKDEWGHESSQCCVLQLRALNMILLDREKEQRDLGRVCPALLLSVRQSGAA